MFKPRTHDFFVGYRKGSIAEIAEVGDRALNYYDNQINMTAAQKQR